MFLRDNKKSAGSTDESTDLSIQLLTPASFVEFYRKFVAIRFPLDIADVIEIRDVINDALEKYQPPENTIESIEFSDALKMAIDSFGIENQHHSDKLIRILLMLRDFHTKNINTSSSKEDNLRSLQIENRQARSQSVLYGFASLIATIFTSLIWIGMANPSWHIQVITVVLGILCWDYFHSLSALDKEYKKATRQLNNVLRKRVAKVDWKMLIHKLAFILGFKQVSGVNVFNIDEQAGFGDEPYTLH